MNIDKLEDVIIAKINEIKRERKIEKESLDSSGFNYTSDLETLGNILVCDGKLEALNELLDMIE
jgi:hypothetical protein